MGKAMCYLFVVLLGCCTSSFGQDGPKKSGQNVYPRIVATFKRIDQTGPFSPVTIYTPKNWGTFRCSIVMVVTKGNSQTNSYLEANLLFHDGAGFDGVPPNSPFYATVATATRNTNYGEFPFRARPGKPIQIEVVPYGITSSTTYNIFVVVEQLM
jgi:hypothetical protein